MKLPTREDAGEIRPVRTLILGSIMCAIPSLFGPYNVVVRNGSYLTIDFSTAAAVVLMFAACLIVNGMLRRLVPSQAFLSGELYIGYVMAAIGCSICTMGLTLYLIPLLPAVTYLASAENQWAITVIPHVPQWLIPTDPEAIRAFYEGIPKDVEIPWGAWLRPLLGWFPVLFGLYLLTIALAALFRTQWAESERLPYPLVQLPLVMGQQEAGRAVNSFFRSWITWAGAAIPFLLTSLNGLNGYWEFFPQVSLFASIPILRGAEYISMWISFPMLGFAYLINADVALSLWVFHLLGLIVKGYFSMLGVTRGIYLDIYAQSDGGPIMAFVQFGALAALVGNTVWIARSQLRRHLARAWGRGRPADGEDGGSRAIVVQFILGAALMTGWCVAVGIPWWAAVTLVLGAAGTFLGITRILCESGLAATRAQLITGTVVRTLYGTRVLGVSGTMGTLGLSQVWMSDVRTFVMAAVANGFKLTESVRRQGVVMTGMILAVVLALVLSIWVTIYTAYQTGANNGGGWFFFGGPRYAIDFAAHYITNPVGLDAGGIGLIAVGATLMGGLYWLRTHFLGFPLHPVGLALSQVMLTRHMWFSVFLAWLIKIVALRYGGPYLLARIRPFFLGLILGQFISVAVWHFIHFLTDVTGQNLYWL